MIDEKRASLARKIGKIESKIAQLEEQREQAYRELRELTPFLATSLKAVPLVSRVRVETPLNFEELEQKIIGLLEEKSNGATTRYLASILGFSYDKTLGVLGKMENILVESTIDEVVVQDKSGHRAPWLQKMQVWKLMSKRASRRRHQERRRKEGGDFISRLRLGGHE